MSLSQSKYGFYYINTKAQGYSKALLSIELSSNKSDKMIRVNATKFVTLLQRNHLKHFDETLFHLN